MGQQCLGNVHNTHEGTVTFLEEGLSKGISFFRGGGGVEPTLKFTLFHYYTRTCLFIFVSYPPFSFSLLFLAAFLLLSFILQAANQALQNKI
jgi:hypothetical protein